MSESKGARSAAELALRVWDLRQQGWSHRRISETLGVERQTVVRILDRIEKRELARLSKRVSHQKAAQTGWLESWIDEAVQAWEASKQPARRVTVRKDGDGEATVTQVETREGDPAYLDRAIRLAGELRRLWGLDAPPVRAVEDETGQMTYAEMIRRLKENAATHDAEPPDRGPEAEAGPTEPSDIPS